MNAEMVARTVEACSLPKRLIRPSLSGGGRFFIYAKLAIVKVLNYNASHSFNLRMFQDP